MTHLNISIYRQEDKPVWKDLDPDKTEMTCQEVAIIEKATKSSKGGPSLPSVAFRFVTKEGQTVTFETTVKLLRGVVEMAQAL